MYQSDPSPTIFVDFMSCLFFGSNDLYAIQAHPPPQFWTPPEIDFFDVSDDLEQKIYIFFLVQ